MRRGKNRKKSRLVQNVLDYIAATSYCVRGDSFHLASAKVIYEVYQIAHIRCIEVADAIMEVCSNHNIRIGRRIARECAAAIEYQVDEFNPEYLR